jgi:hypothetical protein
MQTSDIKNLAKSLAIVQGAMPPITKDCNNPHFKSKYADLASVISVAYPVLSANGLCVSQVVDEENGEYKLRTILLHESGESIQSVMPLRFDVGKSNAMQSMGSALTYARRYALCAIIGVAAEDDDDGNAASSGAAKGKPAVQAVEMATPEQMQRLRDVLSLGSQATADWFEKNYSAGVPALHYAQVESKINTAVQSHRSKKTVDDFVGGENG